MTQSAQSRDVRVRVSDTVTCVTNGHGCVPITAQLAAAEAYCAAARSPRRETPPLRQGGGSSAGESPGPVGGIDPVCRTRARPYVSSCRSPGKLARDFRGIFRRDARASRSPRGTAVPPPLDRPVDIGDRRCDQRHRARVGGLRDRRVCLGARPRAGSVHGRPRRLHPRRRSLVRPPPSAARHGRVRPRPRRDAGRGRRGSDHRRCRAVAPRRRRAAGRRCVGLLRPGLDRAHPRDGEPAHSSRRMR